MDDEQLIELVSQNDALYDAGNPRYMDMKLKTTIWNEIGSQLNTTALRSKTRWVNIRDRFRRHLAQRRRKSGVAAKKKYKFENDLQFLLPHLNGKRMAPNSSASKEESRSNIVSNSPPDQEQETAKDSAAPEPSDPPPSVTTEITNTAPKLLAWSRRLPATETPATVLMKYIIDKTDSQSKNVEDPIDAFLNGIGVTIKTFSPYYQHLAKGQLFAVVLKLELEQMQTDSTETASPTFESQRESSVVSPRIYDENITKIE